MTAQDRNKNIEKCISTLKDLRSEFEKIAKPRMQYKRIRWALTCAIEALEKQSKLTNVIGQIQELANAFQEGDYTEVHCKDRCHDGCVDTDCSACVLEKAIEIIKEELM